MKIKLARFDIQSSGTFQIAGRGTMKVIGDDALPKGYRLLVGDRARIDGEHYVLCGVEMTSPRRHGGFGIAVRRVEPEGVDLEELEAPCACGCALGHHETREPHACLGPDDERPGCPNQCRGFTRASTWARDLRGDELTVVWAALAAMVVDSHAPQDCLTKRQWSVAERLFRDLDARVNRYRACK